ncbi:LysR family transcriptional regulator [Vibrio sp. JC009]|uniref:LysR family transcriptional regulator n=1 Tax=Vibrio sp. JC009 TaxID=2912314 RepID=UPI0023B1EB5A|nr:LysR family transcriptional regulator [Vibrio sp. JC009]WED23463.1 LysR family transcriptional regulator [Vibrio sp. JC009]
MKRVFDDLNVFCAVVEKGSLKQASEFLGIPHSTVSRRIDALEDALELHLLHRTTREVKVTNRGLQLYRDCAPLLESLSDSVDLAIDDELRFKGSLSVSMPVRAGLDFLGNWLIDFASEHPELNLELSLSNVNLNLVQENVDLAFRVGPLTDSSAIALRLWDIPYSLCATNAFVAAHNINPDHVSLEQLAQLPAVISAPARTWTFMDQKMSEKKFQPGAKLVVDDLDLAYHAVKGGQFIGMLPSEMIKDPQVVELSVPDYKPRTRTMFAYYLGRRHTISQIRHIVDYIKQRNQEEKASLISSSPMV